MDNIILKNKLIYIISSIIVVNNLQVNKIVDAIMEKFDIEEKNSKTEDNALLEKIVEELGVKVEKSILEMAKVMTKRIRKEIEQNKENKPKSFVLKRYNDADANRFADKYVKEMTVVTSKEKIFKAGMKKQDEIQFNK